MIIDVGAEWCGPCHMLAAWLDGEENGFLPDVAIPIRDAVANGDLIWVTVLTDDSNGNPADLATLQRWYAEYPTANVSILADGNDQLVGWILPPGIPSMSYVDENWTVNVIDDRGATMTRVLNYLDDL